MEKTKNMPKLDTGSVGKLMLKYAVPCIISLLVASLYNIADQIFIANAAYLGSYGNAANTAVFPLTVIALAIAVMTGDGCCAFVSICLGSGQKENAHRSVGFAVVMSAISGVLLAVVYYLFADPLVAAFGGTVNEQTGAFAHEYLLWLVPGIPFYMFGQAMNPVIRSDGSPRFAMLSTLAGATVNILLDPLFIFVFKWGMAGAAAATVAGQVITAVLAVFYLFRPKLIKLSRASFVPSLWVMKRTLSLGVCSFLSQISLVAAMAAINNMLRRFGAQDPVFGMPEYSQIPMAVVGIVMKFFQIVISAVVGMAAGCIPVVGYNMGAGRKDRVKKLLIILLSAEACIGFIALFAAEVLPGPLTVVFGGANESVYYTQFALRAFRIYLCTVVLACINKAVFIFLQSMGKALPATLLSMLREIVFGVGFAVLLPQFFGLDGVLYSMPAADILTFIITAAVLVRTFRFLGKKEC